MKEKYTVEIADIPLSIVTDEEEGFLRAAVAQLDERVRDLAVKNLRCSKLDAALLCALDYLGEKMKAEKKIRNLEAQVSLLEAGLRRSRGDADTAPSEAAGNAVTDAPEEKKTMPKPDEPREEVKKEEAQLPLAPIEEESTEADEQSPAEESQPEEPEAASEDIPAEEDAEAPVPEAVEDAPSLREDKLRHIEELLRRRQESPSETADSAPQDASRNEKLREIEELLRGGGSKSLSEALKDAIRS